MVFIGRVYCVGPCFMASVTSAAADWRALGGIVDPATAEVKVISVKDTHSHFDQAKAEAFAGKVLIALNNGALCLMVSIRFSIP